LTPAVLSGQNRPRRSYTTPAAILSIRITGPNIARSRDESNFQRLPLFSYNNHPGPTNSPAVNEAPYSTPA